MLDIKTNSIYINSTFLLNKYYETYYFNNSILKQVQSTSINYFNSYRRAFDIYKEYRTYKHHAVANSWSADDCH